MKKSPSSGLLFNSRPSSVRKFRGLSISLACLGSIFFSFFLLFKVLPEPTKEHTSTSRHQHVKQGLTFLQPYSKLGKFQRAAVSVDSEPCAKIGNDVLIRGGNAFDAAVASMYCNSVVNSQSMGLGGGFIMVMTLKNGTRLALNIIPIDK
ncbi:glutathione hydrolase 1 proenzyme [Eurytemora carolleeae]|uniref:glutathione hydrolase 1 proenzyme n=1 Tax=Eurytemora carolleeae TaxID=1294199 RepID=UPI000C757C36|nr:glutathione hydrolase 1 proenzyme [Eurytemora carolleeae]|eukprot:XP_023345660.1 glutathione hydrolase 1 proenzyme-like [Eurytemora affinis]